ncbi:MAG: M20/M25/M40 family metallo-hydrolase [Steroidobacteraceae bacterium]
MSTIDRLKTVAVPGALGLLAAIVIARHGPPTPLGEDAPVGVFSAERARQQLQDLLAEPEPHPLGSEANARIRKRLRRALDSLGLPNEERSRFVCSDYGRCAMTHNVVAIQAGSAVSRARRSVVLAAHYDSVAAGPGASDDLAGVAAILEVMRALRAGPPLAGPVIALFTDGEEAGLLGAEAFVLEPEFPSVGLVINLEARGTSGASYLFETHEGNATLVDVAAAALRRPNTSSVYYEIYKLLPNDTDLSVFRREGRAGAGFAFLGGAARYHTPRDDLDSLDRGSLQHHGDNVLALARSLASSPSLPQPGGADAVYFSLLGFVVIHWPVSWLPAILAATLILVGLAVQRVLAGAKAGGGAVVTELTRMLLVMAATLLFGWLFKLALGGAGALPADWTAQGSALRAAFLLLPLCLIGVVGLRGPCQQPHAALLSALVLMTILAVALVVLLPGAAYLALLPAAIAAMALFIFPARPILSAALASAACVMLWLPFAWSTYDVLGERGLVPAALSALLTGFFLMPILTTWSIRSRAVLSVTIALAILAALALGMLMPAFSRDVPAQLNVVEASGGGRAVAVLEGDPRMRTVLGAPPGLAQWSPQSVLPWQRRPALAGRPVDALAPLRVLDLESPAESRSRQVAIRVASARDARALGIAVPPQAAVLAVAVNGTAAAAPLRPRAQVSRWRSFMVDVAVGESAKFELTLGNAEPLDLYLFDTSGELQTKSLELSSARDRVAVAYGEGDRSISWCHLRLDPANSSASNAVCE